MKKVRNAARSKAEAESVTVREAARRLGCGLKRIYDLVWSGQLEAQKVNKQWRIPVKAIEERIKGREQNVC
jgi:excisionase family DNA binding protein